MKLPFTATVDGYFLAVIDNNVPFTAAMLPCTATKYPNAATVNGYFKAVVGNYVTIYRKQVVNYRYEVSIYRPMIWILDRGN